MEVKIPIYYTHCRKDAVHTWDTRAWQDVCRHLLYSVLPQNFPTGHSEVLSSFLPSRWSFVFLWRLSLSLSSLTSLQRTFYWPIFFCPLIFPGLSIHTHPVIPLASSSYAFVLSFSVSCSLGWSFQCCFHPFFFFFPASWLSLAVLSSATHTYTLYASPHIFLFFPLWPEIYLLFLPFSPPCKTSILKWKENTLRRFSPNCLFLFPLPSGICSFWIVYGI